jgi:hypothetical protein
LLYFGRCKEAAIGSELKVLVFSPKVGKGIRNTLNYSPFGRLKGASSNPNGQATSSWAAVSIGVWSE